MKILSNNTYLLLIDEKAELKAGGYYITNLGNIYKETERVFEEDEGIERFTNRNFYKPIIAYYPLTKEAKELDLPLLPNPFKIKSTEQIVAEFCRNSENIDYNKIQDKVHLAFLQEDMILLYEQAKSKQFSLEDMKKAWECGVLYTKGSLGQAVNYTFDKLIQSLSTQQLPKEFIPNYGMPFITNSEGKQELVGTYLY